MTVVDVILWTVALSCASILFQGLRSPENPKGLWLTVSGGILVYMGLGQWFQWPWVLPIATSLWMLWIFLPMILIRMTQRLVFRGQYRAAQGVAHGVRFLHPGDGWWEYPEILDALQLAQRGEGSRAVQKLSKFKDNFNDAQSPMALAAIALLYRLQNDWVGYLDWTLELSTHQLPWKQYPTLVVYYLRALAETQDFAAFFQQLDHYLPLFGSDRSNLALLQLFGLAFGGQDVALAKFLQGQQAPVHGEARAFWIATAMMTAGREKSALEEFQQLLESTQDFALKGALRHRLAHPLPNTQAFMGSHLHQTLSSLTVQSPMRSKYDFGHQGFDLSLITYLLIVANLFVFGVEISQGSSQDLEVLFQLGGLWPPAVWEGELWRLLAANFLHFGATHLAMNMLGLWILGPFVERTLGKLSYLLVYLGSGVGAMLCIAYLPKVIEWQPEFTIGASGSVMGLVGAIACITLWGWLVERAAIAAKRFRMVLFMIGIQTVFDFSMKNISITGHLSGLVIGFFLSLLMISIFGFSKQQT